MHPLTYQASKMGAALEFEQFRHLEDRERLKEVRGLVLDLREGLEDPRSRKELNEYRRKFGILNAQVEDDQQFSSPEGHAVWRRGQESARAWVFHPGDIWSENEYELWPERTERELALAAVMDPLLDATLSPDERMLVRLRYGPLKESYEQIATRLGVSRVTVRERFEGHALKGKKKGQRSGGIHAKVRASLLLAYGPREEADDGPTEGS